MEKTISLDNYFLRIGYTGARAATLAVLKAIHELHPQTIAFENLNPFLRLPVLLDDNSLQRKLIAEKRGGYCYEQNLLLTAVLRALGFKVKTVAARILWGTQPGVTTPRSHMLLLVEAEGEHFIADVGFGAASLTAPLQLISGTEQPTPLETYRLLQDGDEYIQQVKIQESWKSVYRFGLFEYDRSDYEVYSWYLSNNPASHFVTGLMAARPVPGGRYSLANNRLSVHRLNGKTEKTLLPDVAALKNALTNTFGLKLPALPDLDNRLQKAFPAEPATV
jgi:N-hydroxyarylamine O-acetyltransferase